MNLAATMTLDGAGFLGPLRAIQGSLGALVGQLGNLGNVLTGLQSAKALIGGVLGELNKPINLAAEMESVNAEFGVLLGNGEKGKKLAADITAFANVTPFESAGLAQNAKTLLAFGTTGDQVLPVLGMLGDVAGSSQEKLDSLTLAFAQVSSAGKLTGGDLLQMVNAGFNPLQEMSRKTGRSLADLRKDMEDGAISSGMVTKAFQTATSEGGRFFQNMQVQSRTFNGLLSTLQDSIATLYRAFGMPVMNALKPILESATELAGSLAPVISDLGERFAKVVTAAGSVGSILARGLIGASQAGELGNLLSLAAEGFGAVFFKNITTGLSIAIRSLSAGLGDVFQSALALFSSPSFFEGLRHNVLSILAEVKAGLMELGASLLEKMPFAKQNGVDDLRRSAGEERNFAGVARAAGNMWFDNVDMAAVLSPLQKTAEEIGDIVKAGFGEALGNISGNPKLQELWDKLQKLGAAVEATADKTASAALKLGAVNVSATGSPTAKGAQGAFFGLRDVAGDNLAKVGGFVGDGTQVGVRDDMRKIINLCDKVVAAAKDTTSAIKDWKPVGLWGQG